MRPASVLSVATTVLVGCSVANSPPTVDIHYTVELPCTTDCAPEAQNEGKIVITNKTVRAFTVDTKVDALEGVDLKLLNGGDIPTKEDSHLEILGRTVSDESVLTLPFAYTCPSYWRGGFKGGKLVFDLTKSQGITDIGPIDSTKTIDIACPPGGGMDGGPDDGGTGCDGDGKCEQPTEGCDCADCASEPSCGGGCTGFTITKVPSSSSFFEGDISQVDGPMPDAIQGFGVTTVGTYTLAAPANLSDCNGPQPCVSVASENFATFWSATSGQLVVDAVSPTKATLSSVVFYKRTVDMNNNVMVDLSGPCLFLKSGTIPTP